MRRKGLSRVCLVAVVVMVMGLGPATYAAGNRFTVAAPQLANLIDPDGSGAYQRLVERAIEPLEMSVEPIFYPYRRALKVFETAQVDCLLSLTDVVRPRFAEDRFIYSYPLGKFSFHIFTRAEAPPIESLEALEGMVVGSIKGHELYLESVLHEKMTLEAVRSEAQAVQMLRMGRLDALIAATPDILPHLDRLSYAPEHPLFQSFDRINCHNTEQNRAFIRALSEQLRRLKESGVYQEVMGPLYVPFDVAP